MNRTHTRVTLDDVARRAGVSLATASRVINQSAGVSEDKVERVWTAINALNYVPHTAAQVLAANETHTLGLLLPAVSGGFFVSMLAGIQQGLSESGYDLLIYSSQPAAPAQRNDDPRRRLRRPLDQHNTDGLLVFADSLEDDELRRIYGNGFPMVLLHRSPPAGAEIPTVTFENKSGARQVVDHLVDVHGCQRIAYLAGPEGHEDSYWRQRGYRESLQAHGIPFDPLLVAAGEFDREAAARAVAEMLARETAFDAIFAGDDESAMGALDALAHAGKRVPQEVAVAGFDDVDVSRHLRPPLTTVRAPIEKAGLQAVRQLVQLIRGGQAEPLTLLPTTLVIRRSCGCNGAGHELAGDLERRAL